jgi:hypothetical protein
MIKLILILISVLPVLLCEAAERENLALRGLVSVSSGEQPDIINDGYRDGLYWDGALTSKWTVELDLGEVLLIDTVKLFFWWGDTRYYKYFMTISADRVNFTEIADGRTNTVPPTKDGLTFTFTPTKSRFVRLHILSNREQGRSGHVREIEVYGNKILPNEITNLNQGEQQ